MWFLICWYLSMSSWVHFMEQLFHQNSSLMGNMLCCNSIVSHLIATNFCTCHNSTAVVACAKFCSDHILRIGMRAKQNLHRTWIAIKMSLVKYTPGLLVKWSLASEMQPSCVAVYFGHVSFPPFQLPSAPSQNGQGRGGYPFYPLWSLAC